jgi:hypothetical protein
MAAIVETAKAAFAFVVLLFLGWTIVFIVGSLVERKLKGDKGGPSLWSSFTWVWDNANWIGIPTLVVGTLYMIWAFNFDGPGIGGPTVLILLMMGAAGMLIGFAPSLRRR